MCVEGTLPLCGRHAAFVWKACRLCVLCAAFELPITQPVNCCAHTPREPLPDVRQCSALHPLCPGMSGADGASTSVLSPGASLLLPDYASLPAGYQAGGATPQVASMASRDTAADGAAPAAAATGLSSAAMGAAGRAAGDAVVAVANAAAATLSPDATRRDHPQSIQRLYVFSVDVWPAEASSVFNHTK